MIDLPNRVRHDAERRDGVEWVLPWPEGLPLGVAAAESEERDATPAERAAVDALIGAACMAADIVIRDIAVVRLIPPITALRGAPRAERTPRQFLAAVLLHRRWLDAPDAALNPVQRWHPGTLGN